MVYVQLLTLQSGFILLFLTKWCNPLYLVKVNIPKAIVHGLHQNFEITIKLLIVIACYMLLEYHNVWPIDLTISITTLSHIILYIYSYSNPMTIVMYMKAIQFIS